MKIRHFSLFEEASSEGQGNGGGGGGGTLLSGAVGGASSSSSGGSSAGSGDEGASNAFDFRSLLDDKGNFRQGWDASLPDDLKPSAAALGKYPNPLELMRGHANASKLIGQKSTLKTPAPDAKAEEVEAFNKQIRGVLGVPENVADYKLAKPEKLPNGITWDEGKAADFAKLAHSLNVPPAAAAKIAEWQINHLGELAQTGKAKLDEWVKGQETELRTEWGKDYEVNLGLAAKFAQLAGFDLNDGQLANNAKFVKAMHTASKLIKPDALVGSDKAAVVMDGKAQAEDIRRNEHNPWHKAYQGLEGPERQKEAQALMYRLQGVKT